MERIGEVTRKTSETDIRIRVKLDGSGESSIRCRVAFLSHMLETFARFSKIDLEVEAEGDLVHHIVEDVAICLGQALSKALGDRQGIKRFGYAIIPMDDALILVSVDLKERSYSVINLSLSEKIEDVSSDDMRHFFRSLADNLQATIHVHELWGSDSHHKIEAAMKALAISIKDAAGVDT